MKFCTKCGRELEGNQKFCTQCGQPVDGNAVAASTTSSANDDGGLGWGLLGFCVPVAGLILYLVWMNDRPNSAKAAGKGALISVILGIVASIVYVIAIIALIGSGSFAP